VKSISSVRRSQADRTKVRQCVRVRLVLPLAWSFRSISNCIGASVIKCDPILAMFQVVIVGVRVCADFLTWRTADRINQTGHVM